MVLINDKKYACGTCIKGHRVSSCTHTDRPLFEVKKKGRPTTQCPHCREKRKGSAGASGSVHTKCACGDVKGPEVIMPGTSTPQSLVPSTPIQLDQMEVTLPDNHGTKKGQPGNKADLPNGLKDVHDMSNAAETLQGLMGEQGVLKAAERKVANLLNPCKCMSGGPCKCCQPKRESRDALKSPSPGASGSRTPSQGGVTDSLVEMFKSKATTSNTPPHESCCATSPTGSQISTPTWSQLMSPHVPHLSPANMHHPAHTSPHVHKTKLYSPYSTSGHSTPRHGSHREISASRQAGWSKASNANLTPVTRLRPLADMNKFLGAMFREDGSIAEQIPRSALGLPGISTFDTMAENGGVKIEPMELDLDLPMQFPTNEDVVIGACTCGEGCECPGCATHSNPPRSGGPHSHEGGCGENCKSCFDCGDHLSLPSGITSISHLLSLAASNVPPPARSRPTDLHSHAHDTRVLPPSVHVSAEAARSMGVVTLKPLECCNGRCQCPPGKCVCEKECCGCCVRCACDEDGDMKMDSTTYQPPPEKPACCTTTPSAPSAVSPTSDCCAKTPVPLQLPPATAGSCCATDKSETPTQTTPRQVSTDDMRQGSIPSNPSPLSSGVGTETSRQSSPHPPAAAQPAIRRTSSTSQGPSGSSRRATLSQGTGVIRSASTGKQASKALALHTTPNHPHAHPQHHPRPILPKPPSSSGPSKPPSHRGSASGQTSAQQSKRTSPSHTPGPLDQPQFVQQVPQPSIPSEPPRSSSRAFDMGLSDFANDGDLLAYINQITSQHDNPGLSHNQPPSSSEGSIDQPLETPDLNFLPTNPMAPDGDGLGMSEQDFFDFLNSAINAPSMDANPPSAPQQQQQPGPTPSQPDFSASVGTRSPLDLGKDGNQQPVDTGLSLSLVDLFASMAANNSLQSTQNANPEPVYHQLPPQSTAYLQQVFAQNPSFAPAPAPAPTAPASVPAAPASAPNTFNPDMIDLSKPLNASDMERILRALQQQQTHPQPPPPAPPQQPFQSSFDPSLSFTQEPSMDFVNFDEMTNAPQNVYGQSDMSFFTNGGNESSHEQTRLFVNNAKNMMGL